MSARRSVLYILRIVSDLNNLIYIRNNLEFNANRCTHFISKIQFPVVAQNIQVYEMSITKQLCQHIKYHSMIMVYRKNTYP
mgnify:FL=1